MLSTRMAIRLPLSSIMISILTWCSRGGGARFAAERLLELLDFRDTPAVPVEIREFRVQVGAHQFGRQFRTHHARSKTEHVHAVIFHSLMRGERIVAGGGPGSLEFVRGHAGAGARAADQ